MTPVLSNLLGARALEPLLRAQITALAWYQRLTARERLLLGAMALVACLLAPIKAFDLSQTATQRLVDAQTRLETARQQGAGGSMAAIARSDKQLKAVQQWSWTMPSLTVAQVMLDQQLSVMAAQAKMTAVTITAADVVEPVGPLKFVRLEVSAAFDWTTLTAFLKALSNSHKGFVLSSIAVEGEGPGKVRIVLEIPIRVSGGQRQ